MTGGHAVAAAVTDRKLQRQLELWDDNADVYARRGWLMLRRDLPVLEIGFLARVSFAGRPVPVMSVCIRLDYSNFDRMPPSLTFIDALTRIPVEPLVQAPDIVDGQLGNALVDAHPNTQRPFLCLPGIREYHLHPQHSGDDWLLHRDLGEGDLPVVCERVWRRMARNVVGVTASVLSLPNMMRLELSLAQADPDAIQAEITASQQPVTAIPSDETP